MDQDHTYNDSENTEEDTRELEQLEQLDAQESQLEDIDGDLGTVSSTDAAAAGALPGSETAAVAEPLPNAQPDTPRESENDLPSQEAAAGKGSESSQDTRTNANAALVPVVGVRFRSAGRVYYFSPGDLDIHRGTHVIVDTVRGTEYGTAVSRPFQLDQNKFKAPLKKIKRIATTEDTDRHEENLEREQEARRICQSKIRAHHLDMKLIDAEYTFDGNKILFYFTADGRVDFRDLVRDLAGIFHTRIELRQVGVRDETRILGGYGVCGRPLCCHTYLTDFVPVSIRMAKEQNLSLNPSKISGVCGRLMCCLKNEEDTYEELNKTLPHVGDEVESVDGLQGEVENVNVLRQRVRILVEKDDEKELHEYDAKDLTILRRRRRGQSKPHFHREDVSGSVTSHVRGAEGTEAGANPAGTGDALRSGPAAGTQQSSGTPGRSGYGKNSSRQDRFARGAGSSQPPRAADSGRTDTGLSDGTGTAQNPESAQAQTQTQAGDESRGSRRNPRRDRQMGRNGRRPDGSRGRGARYQENAGDRAEGAARPEDGQDPQNSQETGRRPNGRGDRRPNRGSQRHGDNSSRADSQRRGDNPDRGDGQRRSDDFDRAASQGSGDSQNRANEQTHGDGQGSQGHPEGRNGRRRYRGRGPRNGGHNGQQPNGSQGETTQ